MSEANQKYFFTRYFAFPYLKTRIVYRGTLTKDSPTLALRSSASHSWWKNPGQ